jgi:thioesterase domain-containing protein
MALAVAEALEHRGLPVQRISLVDTYLYPGSETWEGEGTGSLLALARETLVSELPGHAAAVESLLERAASLVRTSEPQTSDELLQRLLAWVDEEDAMGLGISDLMRRQLGIIAAHYTLLKGYRPARLHAPIDVYRASEWIGEGRRPPLLDGHSLTEGRTAVEEVPGSHYTLMRSPAVEILAARMAARCARP